MYVNLTSEKNCFDSFFNISMEHVSFLLTKHSNAAAYAWTFGFIWDNSNNDQISFNFS